MPGSHTQLFDEHVEFFQDGTGEIRTSSVMQVRRSCGFQVPLIAGLVLTLDHEVRTANDSGQF
jgi:hypothetical protein